jgi:hypothetical protein
MIILAKTLVSSGVAVNMFRLRVILLEAFVVDIVLGVFLIIFASKIQGWLSIGIREEPIFIRIVGGFLIFIGYLYYLAYRYHERQPILVQSTLILRFIFILLLLTEIFILLPGPFSVIKVSLLIPVLGEVYFAGMQVYHLKKLKIPLILSGG